MINQRFFFFLIDWMLRLYFLHTYVKVFISILILNNIIAQNSAKA